MDQEHGLQSSYIEISEKSSVWIHDSEQFHRWMMGFGVDIGQPTMWSIIFFFFDGQVKVKEVSLPPSLGQRPRLDMTALIVLHPRHGSGLAEGPLGFCAPMSIIKQALGSHHNFIFLASLDTARY